MTASKQITTEKLRFKLAEFDSFGADSKEPSKTPSYLKANDVEGGGGIAGEAKPIAGSSRARGTVKRSKGLSFQAARSQSLAQSTAVAQRWRNGLSCIGLVASAITLPSRESWRSSSQTGFSFKSPALKPTAPGTNAIGIAGTLAASASC
jgi:hypothetical protein